MSRPNFAKIQQRREALQARLTDIQRQVDARAEREATVAEAIEYCRQYRAVALHATPAEKRQILTDLVGLYPWRDTIEKCGVEDGLEIDLEVRPKRPY